VDLLCPATNDSAIITILQDYVATYSRSRAWVSKINLLVIFGLAVQSRYLSIMSPNIEPFASFQLLLLTIAVLAEK
jgi:hypothetical protein